MTIEICSSKPKEVDFTFNGKPLFVRNLPLKLGLKMQAFVDDASIPPELLAEIVSQCVVDGKGKPVWSADDVLGFDLKPMLQIFTEVSGTALNVDDAKKN